ncbi:hypothetical protein GS584_22995 [Rhodococcus hoagii]|nr:hypothetical protein [Prescottella equi]
MNAFAPIASTGMSLAFGSGAGELPSNRWAMLRAAVKPPHSGQRGVCRARRFSAATRGAWRAAVFRDGMGAP